MIIEYYKATLQLLACFEINDKLSAQHNYELCLKLIIAFLSNLTSYFFFSNFCLNSLLNSQFYQGYRSKLQAKHMD